MCDALNDVTDSIIMTRINRNSPSHRSTCVMGQDDHNMNSNESDENMSDTATILPASDEFE